MLSSPENAMQRDAINNNTRLLQTSFLHLLPKKEAFVTTFYEHLFASYPHVKPLFIHTDMRTQRSKLLSALSTMVNNAQYLEQLRPTLRELGRNHKRYQVRPEHYAIVGEVLLQTLAEFLGAAWTEEVCAAWTEAYTTIAKMMSEEWI